MTDNGGQFSSDEMREITSILNIQLCNTAGESPFHAITDMMLVKLEAEYGKTHSQTILSWANMARNSLQMWNGYSSHQLVFGENPNLPNIMNDNLPALEGTTSSEVFAKHFNAPHVACKIFIHTEADARIKRALRNKVRASEQIFENADRVFLQTGRKRALAWTREGCFSRWKGCLWKIWGIFVRAVPDPRGGKRGTCPPEATTRHTLPPEKKLIFDLMTPKSS